MDGKIRGGLLGFLLEAPIHLQVKGVIAAVARCGFVTGVAVNGLQLEVLVEIVVG